MTTRRFDKACWLAVGRPGSRACLAAAIPLLLLVFTGALPAPAAAQEVRAGAAAPTAEELAAATYRGIESDPVTLRDGRWEGEPAVEGGASVPRVDLVPGVRITGDLDGDGADEAVALLHYNFGGTGVFSHLAVVRRGAGGEVENVATTELGDRIQVRSAAVADAAIELETVEAGPEDASCCPGQRMRRVFALQDSQLVESSSEVLGRLSIADLGGVTWRLTHWAPEEPVADGVEVDLTLEEDRIAGRSGCNRYQGGVADGDLPGDLVLTGPLAGTRMACPPPLDEVERRYLDALQKVHRFWFSAGRLVLSWGQGEDWGTLTFAPEPGGDSARPSFDCAKAESAAEKLVCRDEDLARLDRQLDEVYGKAIGRWPPEEVESQRTTQRGWIQQRDDCAEEEDLRECVSFAYRSRIAEIQIQSGQLVVPAPLLYVCSEDEREPFYVTYYQQTDPPSAVVTYDRRQVILFVARSASGARYTAPGVELWEHQGEATVDFFGTKLKCKVR